MLLKLYIPYPHLLQAACKLKPEDPTARHLLGRWSYSVADVPWYMKSAAKYILAELPNASYEDVSDNNYF